MSVPNIASSHSLALSALVPVAPAAVCRFGGGRAFRGRWARLPSRSHLKRRKRGASAFWLRHIYQTRRFSELSVLADAFEEANYADQQILEHCRRKWEHEWGLLSDRCRVGECLAGNTPVASLESSIQISLSADLTASAAVQDDESAPS